MNERGEGRPIRIRLMNEYGVHLPLWDDEGVMSDEYLRLTDALRADLVSFASRWEDSISPEVADDRWDGHPIGSKFSRARYALPRVLNPRARRRATAESATMRDRGQQLRARLQEELGSDFVVTYHG